MMTAHSTFYGDSQSLEGDASLRFILTARRRVGWHVQAVEGEAVKTWDRSGLLEPGDYTLSWPGAVYVAAYDMGDC